MSWITIALLSALILSKVIHHFIINRENRQSDEIMDHERKLNAKKLLEERAERMDFSEIEESEFWDIMDEVQSRSKTSFKNSMGVFKDLIKKYSAEELIRLDNLLSRLFKENVNQDIYAASRIIFKTPDLGATLLLMNLLMTRGEVFFKQACYNPNLIIGKEFTDIDGSVFQDIISQVYSAKTLKLIPEVIYPEDFILKIPGQECTDKELPSRYEELWFNYY